MHDFPLDPLTPREMEILLMISDGLRDGEIADRLVIAIGTVKWHNKNLLGKFGVTNRTALVARAREIGLLDKWQRNQPDRVEVNPKHNLQLSATSFIGRETDLSSILSLLDQNDCRLVTLVGVGGIGKTRLAIQCAERLITTFPNGTYFVSLDSVSASLLPIAIADALGFRPAGKDDLRVQLLRYARDRKMLLILDSFEHLISEASFVAQLVSSAAYLKVIVTSRTILNVAEEWIYTVEGLSYPAVFDKVNIETYGAIKLFTDRALRIRRDFSILEEGKWIVLICRAVNGMPLALELLTTWINVLSCREIAEELDHNRDMIAAGRPDLPDRQHSIRAVFDQSWNLLSFEEQSVFMKLSVFRGGFIREAFQVVTQTTLRELATLINKSLVSANKHGRHTIHLLLRHYAEEKLGEQPGIAFSTRVAHSDYYAHLLTNETVHSDVAWQEVDNIWTGMSFAVTERQFSTITTYIHGLWRTYEERGWYQTEASILKLYADAIAVLENAQPLVDKDVLREAYESLANLLYVAHRYTDARSTYQSALSYGLQVENRVMQARLYHKIALTYASQRNEVETMFTYYHQAESALGVVAADVQHAWWTVWIQIKLDLGWAYYTRMDVPNMVRLLEEVEKPIQERGTPLQRSKFYFNRNLIDLRSYRFYQLPDRSVQDAEKAIEAALQTNDLRELALVEMAKGFVLLWRDEYEKAEFYFLAAIEHARQFGDTMGSQATVLTYIPLIYRRWQQVDKVEKWAREGLELATEANTPFYVGTSLGHLGWVSYRRGKLDEAKVICQKAIDTWALVNFPIPMQFMARIPLLALLLADNVIDLAIENARHLIDFSQKRLHDPLPSLLTQAIAAWDAQDSVQATALLKTFCELCPPFGYL